MDFLYNAFSFIAGILATSAGLLLKYYLDKKRYYQDRFWDMRIKIYSEILFNLNKSMNKFRIIKEGSEQFNDDELYIREEYIENSRTAHEYIDEVIDVFRKNEVIIGNNVRINLLLFLDELQNSDYQNFNPVERELYIADAVENTLDNIRKAAREELSS